MKKFGLTLLAALALSSTQAMAIVIPTDFTETADAGSLAGQATNDPGTNITSITGSTGSGDYEDLFSFNWGGGLFEAATNGLFGSSRDFDTMLFLFNGDGTFVTSNDDSGSLGSYISADLIAGNYLLGITGYGFTTVDTTSLLYDARDENGLGFQFGGGSGTLTSWGWGAQSGASPATGNYTIGINGSSTVPEPAPLALLALGLTALGLAKRKSR